MNDAFYVGAAGLQAQQTSLEITANNIANVNTDGFKRSEVHFMELVNRPKEVDNRPQLIVDWPELSPGVQARTSHRVMEQGKIRETGSPLQMAIRGDGFIEVLGPSGQTWLWRGGNVRLNADGYMETENGLILKAMVELPKDAGQFTISREGKVSTVLAGDQRSSEIGIIDLVMPDDVVALEAVGGGFYRVSDDASVRVLEPGTDNGGVFVQGAMETSNVELTTEMVTLLLTQRAYAANAQVVQAGDQLMGIANGLRR